MDKKDFVSLLASDAAKVVRRMAQDRRDSMDRLMKHAVEFPPLMDSIEKERENVKELDDLASELESRPHDSEWAIERKGLKPDELRFVIDRD